MSNRNPESQVSLCFARPSLAWPQHHAGRRSIADTVFWPESAASQSLPHPELSMQVPVHLPLLCKRAQAVPYHQAALLGHRAPGMCTPALEGVLIAFRTHTDTCTKLLFLTPLQACTQQLLSFPILQS